MVFQSNQRLFSVILPFDMAEIIGSIGLFLYQVPNILFVF